MPAPRCTAATRTASLCALGPPVRQAREEAELGGRHHLAGRLDDEKLVPRVCVDLLERREVGRRYRLGHLLAAVSERVVGHQANDGGEVVAPSRSDRRSGAHPQACAVSPK